MADFKLFSMSGEGKGLGIFKATAYKPHEVVGMQQMFWRWRWNNFLLVFTFFAFAASFGAEHVWRYGWSPASQQWLLVFWQNALSSFGLSIFAEIPAYLERLIFRTDIAMIAPLIPFVLYYMLHQPDFIEKFNPHGEDVHDKQSTHEATRGDIKAMGLFDGFMMVLGYFEKRPLKMPETLSALCVAPPGTGKTAGVVVPTIFECAPNVSMIINDPKPELKQRTSGFCAKHGFVFIMNWAGQDDPINNIYYPSWNPLSPSHVPFAQENRDLYIDSICRTLVPDKAGTSADPHWTISGRAALSGFVHFIVSKIDKAKADDYFYHRLRTGTFDKDDAGLLAEYYGRMNDMNAHAAINLVQSGQLNINNYVHVGTWKNIPPAWYGKEASFAMILDWMNSAQIKASEAIQEKVKQGNAMAAVGADPMRDVFEDASAEARTYGYSHRAVLELTQLANTPDKERGSIMSTALLALAIFRNAAVRNRTSHSDFHFSDLRGIKDPKDGKFKPTYVYLSVNMVDADAVNPITAIFIELMSNFLLSNAPDGIHAGHKLGPYPVLFVLDEFPKMQRLSAVIQGPDLGRGQKVSYLIIGQDLNQIKEKYGPESTATLMSTTAAKIIMKQNDVETAETFSRILGEESILNAVGSKEAPKTARLYSALDIRALKDSKQLISYQANPKAVIEADKEYYFKNPKLKAMSEVPESPPLPPHLVDSHILQMGYDPEKITAARRAAGKK